MATSHQTAAMGSVVVATASELIRGLLFDAGWWSVATWLAFVLASGSAVAVLVRYPNELTAGLLVAAGPIAAMMLMGALQAVADPDPGCTSDCYGRLLFLGPCGGLLLGWAIGLVGGVAWTSAKRRDVT
jgi:hypothetical protein